MRQSQGHIEQGQLWMGRVWGQMGWSHRQTRDGVMTDDHIPLQGFTTQVTGLAADFAEDGLHVALVVGRQHHGVTFALAAPSTGALAGRRCPLYAVPGQRPPPAQPGPARPAPLRPRRRWSPARRSRPPPASTAPRSALRHRHRLGGSGPRYLMGFESGLGPGITSAQAEWSIPSGTD